MKAGLIARRPAAYARSWAGEDFGILRQRFSPRREELEVDMARRLPSRKTFRVGDHVEWNSEAGRVRGTVIKRLTADTKVDGYVHHASPAEPQYLIQSDKTSHVAIHKGSALRILGTPAAGKNRAPRHADR